MMFTPCLRASVCLLLLSLVAHAAGSDMQPVGKFEIDRTEVTIGEFGRFVQATGTVTAAERAGGGSTYEGGWQKRPGWTWRAPFGTPGGPHEPAVHVTYAEAEAFCRWAGKRLPSDAEWGEAAYVERRANSPAGFVTGRRYPYPTGDTPLGANCLGDCGSVRTVAHAVTSRGRGHAEVGTTKAGVNGLYDMGGNAWEWVDSGPGAEKRTRGGSWWYGAAQMRDEHRQHKPGDTAVVYIGFRCARTLARSRQSRWTRRRGKQTRTEAGGASLPEQAQGSRACVRPADSAAKVPAARARQSGVACARRGM